VDFSTYQETEKVWVPSFCYWCHYSQCNAQKTANLHHTDLIRFAQENRYRMSPHQYVRAMQKRYNDTVRERMLMPDGVTVTRGPYWPARNIWEHDEVHVSRPENIAELGLRVMHSAMTIMRDNGIFTQEVKRDPITQRVVSKKRGIDDAKLTRFLTLFQRAYTTSLAVQKQKQGSEGSKLIDY